MVSGWASDKFTPDDDWLIWGNPAGFALPLGTDWPLGGFCLTEMMVGEGPEPLVRQASS